MRRSRPPIERVGSFPAGLVVPSDCATRSAGTASPQQTTTRTQRNRRRIGSSLTKRWAEPRWADLFCQVYRGALTPWPPLPSPPHRPGEGEPPPSLFPSFGWWRPLSRGTVGRWERGSGGEGGRGKAPTPRDFDGALGGLNSHPAQGAGRT